MLQNLEVLMAFAVVMLVVSLLIMVLTQFVSALLSLRGTNLRWGLSKLIGTLDNEAAGDSDRIAKFILTHDLVSDSTWAGRDIKSKLRLVSNFQLATCIRFEEFQRVLTNLSQNPSLTPLMKTTITNLGNKINADKVAAEAWFKSTMDRVSTRFQTEMRVWTVALSVVVALFLHMDTPQLLKQLGTDRDARARLLAVVDGVLSDASQVFENDKNIRLMSTNALTKLKGGLPKEQSDKLGELPANVTTQNAAEEWLRTQLGSEATPDVMNKYDELFKAEFTAAVDKVAGSGKAVMAQMEKAELTLLPDPYHSFDFVRWFGYLPGPNAHLLGVLVTGALLSLGAPFWFNQLRTASSLKSALASREETERKPKA